MTYGFRVCFRFPGPHFIAGDDDHIVFGTVANAVQLKLAAGAPKTTLGDSDRFSVSGGAFDTSTQAQEAAESVWNALLLLSAQGRWGIDLGQAAQRSFSMSDALKNILDESSGASAVEDHLGVTVFPSVPTPIFIRMEGSGFASYPAQSFVASLADTIGRYRLVSPRAELAAGLYALNHFVARDPARFLLLFIAVEALLEPACRSQAARAHVDSLIEATRKSALPEAEIESICSVLPFQKRESIARTGRLLAEQLLATNSYDGLTPGDFFAKIYRVRCALVHRGQFEPPQLRSLVSETDRFVADIVTAHATRIGDGVGVSL